MKNFAKRVISKLKFTFILSLFVASELTRKIMYLIRLYLLLFSVSICLCLLPDIVDYIDLDDELDWDGSNELDTNSTEIPPDSEYTTNSTPIIENVLKNISVDEALAAETKVHELSTILKSTIHRIRQQFKKMDIVFLIDSSSSVGKTNFRSELKFVTKFLSDFNVSFNYTRVSIVTFSSQEKIVRHVDHISEADPENDKCKLLNFQMPAIEFSGGGTHTADALIQATNIMMKARRHSKKIICLITDGFSNGEDPLPIAEKLKAENITIITFGIQSGNFAELHRLSSDPGYEHSFLLDSFAQFESLARKALHTDYKIGNAIRIKNSSLCDTLCDNSQLNETSSCCDLNAECTCSTISGHYSCLCAPGYYGSGLTDNCDLCPNGTYWHSWNLCKPCPDINHITSEFPAVNSSYCACKSGFKADANNRCEILRCPMLQPPENGYFVKHPLGCDRVLNTACGARCKSGYQLIGSSIRLCQDNGTWSGVEAKCVLKTCPKLPVPFYGMATCKNNDLNLFFDYTPRNETFMEYYNDEELRTTELMPIDTDCKFKCGPGFYMIGSATRNCLPLSKWDGLMTTCKQIMCSGLPEVSFGYYDPTDCTNQKVVHGSNCTLICDPGFEPKGGLKIKTCGGKKSGVWSNRSKLPKCVDVTPPSLMCPQNFSVPMIEDDDHALVKIFPAPNVTDNSGGNITFFLKPSVKEDGVQLQLGNHTFSYIAVDPFRNKARCNFTIIVLDITPPNIDNCINPPEIFIPSAQNLTDNRSFVDWAAPIIYDNSNIDVNVTQSIHPGHIGIGVHTVIYTAIDSSGNKNVCTSNVTVKPLQCNTLSAPANGKSLCAKNETHTWCDVVCDLGFSIYDGDDEHSDHVRYICENDSAQWPYDPLPDCTKIELPDSIEQVFSITLDDDVTVCKNNSELTTSMVHNLLISQIRQQLCEDLEQCEILSEIPDCNEITRNNLEFDGMDETTNRNYYSVVKRDASTVEEKRNPNRMKASTSSRNNANMKIKIYTKISKGLGLWSQNVSRAENLEIVKQELKTYHTNERLRSRLNSLRINVKHLNLEENLLCRTGSVLKRSVCVQCPRGTLHNKTLNRCQMCKFGYYNDKEGQVECQKCPKYQSTRKVGAKTIEECIEQCPPGTQAHARLRANQKIQTSLMPNCAKCSPAQYQPDFNQIKCLQCPSGMTSPRGAISIDNCFEEKRDVCQINSAICGPHGICVQENGNRHLYSCLCEDGFTGSHCEQQYSLCVSAPCHNNGQCVQVNSTSFKCEKCPDRFTGDTCEIEISSCSNDYCSNFGTCIETDRKPVCECAPGYAGEFCEIRQNFCSNNPCESGQCLNSADGSGWICKCPPGIIGRRCHLRPCDYLPCHRNAQCVDLPILGATRRSFRCVCPKGLKGDTCTQIKSACESNPCKNNGICTPFALRNINHLHSDDEFDENIYDKYNCKCPPYFYGANCETFVTPDYVLEFTKPGVHNYVKLNGPTNNLNEISFCTWIQTNDSFNYGTIFSYATDSIDNMFTLTDYNGIVLYVHGKNIITDIELNDGEWHFICVSWMSLNANGTVVVGQEQDSIGSNFSDLESFVGRIAYMDVWNRRISADEMIEFYTTCEPYQGNLFTWTDFKSKIYGAVKILKSPFCQRCAHNLMLKNGFIRYLENRAFHYCNDGYKIQGPSIRNCLRTSKWSLPVPYCRSINCGQLPSLLNGQVTMEKTSVGEIAKYSCNDNYVLVGANVRYCLNNSTWSDSQPECISLIKCDRLKAPHNGRLIYANEHGRIADNQPNFPMGTFVEVQCENETILKGDGFLSCIDSGIWDLPLPECIPIPITTTTATTKSDIRITTVKPTTATVKATKITTRSTFQTKVISVSMAKFGAVHTTAAPKIIEVQKQRHIELSTTTAPKPMPIKLTYLPDKHFWIDLKELYYHGCNNNNKMSPILCALLKNPSNYTDLTLYELPDTSDFKHMDQKLLTHLTQADESLNAKPDRILTMEHLFPFILYGFNDSAKNQQRMPSTVENAYRYVLCLYIDTILFDRNLNLTFLQEPPSGDDNVTQKLKYFIVRVTSKVFDEYSQAMRRMSQRIKTIPTQVESTSINSIESVSATSSVDESVTESIAFDTTTISLQFDENDEILNAISSQMKTTTSSESEANEESCQLEALPEIPSNSYFSEIKLDNETLFNTPDRLYLIGPMSVRTRAYVMCKDGFKAKSNQPYYFECNENLKWNGSQIECKAVTCGTPILNELSFNSRNSKNHYAYGQKLQLKCNPGYELKGEPYVQCLATGMWSRNISNCSRISCLKPDMPEHAKIIHATSYLYSDKMIFSCNAKIFEIVCKADGQWSQQPKQLCPI
ncbi:sushi, von Willebrand factor type A, EGF and pentraxin domain-containing protein 1-like isoform X2 [Contarinia nasturtii]|uniref:sushi, von Willebrand factor type A, EGF and pentraxin domain-containing protein 1-like isoform X2 n=1 Tax=Contarinia nasturtii TaxID=265458 RepID=UPI0012D4688C|nr:sushi, von Willebrand factor type A, EGF and pentraxin domain-containing protein 1-like isoform X2 [Contarinia nasturtii]